MRVPPTAVEQQPKHVGAEPVRPVATDVDQHATARDTARAVVRPVATDVDQHATARDTASAVRPKATHEPVAYDDAP